MTIVFCGCMRPHFRFLLKLADQCEQFCPRDREAIFCTDWLFNDGGLGIVGSEEKGGWGAGNVWG